MRNRIIVEIFAGVGGITASCRRAGLNVAEPWDILYGPQFDLLCEKQQKKLLRLLSSGHVYLVWFGTPCTSFSQARSPVRLRIDLTQPVPGLSARDFELFTTGTALAEFTAKAIVAAHLSGAHFVLENPRSSTLWQFPAIERALISTGAVFTHTVYCAWGERWVKPTTFAGTLPKLSSLERHCDGRGGRCQHSLRAHRILRGKNRHGIWWTKIAEPYPEALCDAVADIIYVDQSARGLVEARESHEPSGAAWCQ